jgi:hypothetical protein
MNAEQPRRWLPISREVGIPIREDGADSLSLDHLFLDQDAVPTLVEVKRSSDTRIRREVVGQMLDDAAHAVAYGSAFALCCLDQRLGGDLLSAPAEQAPFRRREPAPGAARQADRRGGGHSRRDRTGQPPQRPPCPLGLPDATPFLHHGVPAAWLWKDTAGYPAERGTCAARWKATPPAGRASPGRRRRKRQCRHPERRSALGKRTLRIDAWL